MQTNYICKRLWQNELLSIFWVFFLNKRFRQQLWLIFESSLNKKKSLSWLLPFTKTIFIQERQHLHLFIPNFYILIFFYYWKNWRKNIAFITLSLSKHMLPYYLINVLKQCIKRSNANSKQNSWKKSVMSSLDAYISSW